MTTQADLDDSGLRIESLWRVGAPTRTAEMLTRETFYDFILALQRQEERLYCNLIERGMTVDQAREILLEASAPPLSEQP